MVGRCMLCIMMMCALGMPFILEQPSSSVMEHHPCFQHLAQKFRIYKVTWLNWWLGICLQHGRKTFSLRYSYGLAPMEVKVAWRNWVPDYGKAPCSASRGLTHSRKVFSSIAKLGPKGTWLYSNIEALIKDLYLPLPDKNWEATMVNRLGVDIIIYISHSDVSQVQRLCWREQSVWWC